MGKPIIKVLDSVHCKANKEAREIIVKSKCLQYTESKWKKERYGRRTATQTKHHLIQGRKGSGGQFLTGLLPRVKSKTRGIKIVGLENATEWITTLRRPKVGDIQFRPDQMTALHVARNTNRGVILFPTGSGKTIIALGIMSMFPRHRTLFLCHTKDLIQQTAAELKEFKFKNVFIMGGGYKTDIRKVKKTKGAILVATIQSFSKLEMDDYVNLFDITIVDEVHHVNKKNSQYGKIMERNLSPRKYGFTATMSTKTHESLVNEGFFGKVIAQLSLEEGIQSGILAKPNLNLIPVEYNPRINIKSKNTYSKFYKFGVIRNKKRNLAIINEVNIELKKGNITLIVIDRTEHGEKLKKLFKKTIGLKVPFVQGSTKRGRRLRVKNKLQSGQIKVAICSKVWREGINIPSLNHIVNACGMKEEKAVLQTIGRGLRTTENKTVLKFTDFLDPYRYLAEHTIQRMQVYKKKGWI